MLTLRRRDTRGISGVLRMIEEVVVEYYGHATWIMLKQHIYNRGVDINSIEEVLEAVKEFFGGSQEILDVIVSKYSDENVEEEFLNIK